MRALTDLRWNNVGALSALSLAVGLWWLSAPSVAQKAQGKAPPPVPVKVAPVVVQDQALSLSAVGQVQASQQAVVRARIEGLLTEVRFTEGQVVRQGQVLARLDDRSLRAQVAQAQGELRRLQAQLDLAQLELQRTQGLVAASAVSTQQRDQQQAQVAQLQAQVQSQQASLSQAQTQLSYTVITAPFTGRVGLRQVDVGNVVRPTDAQGIVTLVQTQPLVVVFHAPQTRLADVRRATQQAGGAVVTVAEREGGPILARGRLQSTDNAVDAGSGTLKLKAELAPSGDRLWPGQFVTVDLSTGAMPGALTLPAKAVQRGLRGSVAWRVVQGQAQMVPVQPRWQSDAVVVIEPQPDGLKAGDLVVVDGQSRLKPQASVKVLDGTGAARATRQP
ncbi:MAG TPA: efflux RND transporter periplasmic adaptor subunit [Aquabacterium sp.]|uniref:efflux RND transporter periplasmic adaptor subunit n=1 Tax=Aquabacterium sp. TaxID=1872578 RepID=UPI002E354AE7|nr:efflux RND transporter periplasmic adaptor subunit [Aquabacterium sp.]HEX5373316.1 efflux RND transporter periplasmic adaptor subunit [Aquabacterium sp.]